MPESGTATGDEATAAPKMKLTIKTPKDKKDIEVGAAYDVKDVSLF